ncbi:MAG: hypothetical protein U5K37_13005 [Natrialbaceae archaeon]|nr:hypothetical protein [Natrialbaceae archaeon]
MPIRPWRCRLTARWSKCRASLHLAGTSSTRVVVVEVGDRRPLAHLPVLVENLHAVSRIAMQRTHGRALRFM